MCSGAAAGLTRSGESNPSLVRPRGRRRAALRQRQRLLAQLHGPAASATVRKGESCSSTLHICNFPAPGIKRVNKTNEANKATKTTKAHSLETVHTPGS